MRKNKGDKMKAIEIMNIAELNKKISNIKFLKNEKENAEYIAMINKGYMEYAGPELKNMEVKEWSIDGNIIVLWV